MNLSKTFINSFNVLNLTLFALVIILFFILDYPLISNDFKTTIVKTNISRLQNERKYLENSNINYPDYMVIFDKNLFHPERKEIVNNKENQPIVKPDIVLYGTLITQEKKIAYIEDKKNNFSTPGRGKRQTVVVLGSKISGYTLQEINPESIVLIYGDDKMTVVLRDKKDRKQKELSEANPQHPNKVYNRMQQLPVPPLITPQNRPQ